MTSQSGGSGNGLPVGGVLSGTLPNPAFGTNGTTSLLGVVTAVLGATVPMTNANQFYDGPSVALTAGVWLLIGVVTSSNPNGSTGASAKLWDGTTNLASGWATLVNAGNECTIPMVAVYTTTVPATAKLSVAHNNAGGTIQTATAVNPAGNTASYLIALRIA